MSNIKPSSSFNRKKSIAFKIPPQANDKIKLFATTGLTSIHKVFVFLKSVTNVKFPIVELSLKTLIFNALSFLHVFFIWSISSFYLI